MLSGVAHEDVTEVVHEVVNEVVHHEVLSEVVHEDLTGPIMKFSMETFMRSTAKSFIVFRVDAKRRAQL